MVPCLGGNWMGRAQGEETWFPLCVYASVWILCACICLLERERFIVGVLRQHDQDRVPDTWGMWEGGSLEARSSRSVGQGREGKNRQAKDSSSGQQTGAQNFSAYHLEMTFVFWRCVGFDLNAKLCRCMWKAVNDKETRVFWRIARCCFVFTDILIETRITWEERLTEDLSGLHWPVGMSAGDCPDC